VTVVLLAILAAGRISGTVTRAPRAAKLANVVVHVAAPGEAAADPVVLTHRDSRLEPHVSAAAKGQRLVVKNGDATTHDAHASLGTDGGITLFNAAQAPGSRVERALDRSGVVRVECDLHAWTRAWVVVSDGPYSAVSNADGGWAIDGVPAGTWKVEAWHERYGAKTVEVTVEDGKTTSLPLSFP
jgi:hypothetical protein